MAPPDHVLAPLVEKLKSHLRSRDVLVFGHNNVAWHLQLLLDASARHVLAVDKAHPSLAASHLVGPDLSFEVATFEDWNDAHPEAQDIVFLAWPHSSGGPVPDRVIREVCERAETVIYIGSNTDGFASGDREFWTHLVLERDVLDEYVFNNQVLHVYGAPHLPKARSLVADEVGAMQRLQAPEMPYLKRADAVFAAGMMAAAIAEQPDTESGLRGALASVSRAAGHSFREAALDAFDRGDRDQFLKIVEVEATRIEGYRQDFLKLQDIKAIVLRMILAIRDNNKGVFPLLIQELAAAVGLGAEVEKSEHHD